MAAMTNPAPLQSTAVEEADAADDDNLVEEDLLVEEISIDGMCGVY
jgi:mycofactocin precursor